MLPLQAAGVSQLSDKKRNGTYWMQECGGKTSKESVSFEQGQLLRAAEPVQCVSKVKPKSIPETPIQRQRDILELTHLSPVSWYSACVYGEARDDPHRRQQEWELPDKSFDHADVAAETEMTNKRLKVEVLVDHSNGSVAAMVGPKDITEHSSSRVR